MDIAIVQSLYYKHIIDLKWMRLENFVFIVTKKNRYTKDHVWAHFKMCNNTSLNLRIVKYDSRIHTHTHTRLTTNYYKMYHINISRFIVPMEM